MDDPKAPTCYRFYVMTAAVEIKIFAHLWAMNHFRCSSDGDSLSKMSQLQFPQHDATHLHNSTLGTKNLHIPIS